MATEKVAPTKRELEAFELGNPDVVELIHQAEQSDAADRQLTIRQALKKYKKAVFWAMFLSTSLIMEGYDLVIVRKPHMYTRTEYLTNSKSTDNFILRPNTIQKEIWSVGSRVEEQPNSRFVAIRAV